MLDISSQHSNKGRVLLIHTGGTLGMSPEGLPQSSGDFLHLLRAKVPRIFEFADVDIWTPFTKDSSNVGPSDWLMLARGIDERASDWDAFVVIHGTDTMAFTGSALSFLLAGLNKPVVITGSQISLGDPRSDAARNLIHSFEIAAAAQIREVMICFDSLLLRANRAKKLSIPSYKAFSSPNFSPLANLGVKIEYTATEVLPLRTYKNNFKLDSRVFSISVFPGLNGSFFRELVEKKSFNGFVLQGFGPGDLPHLDKDWHYGIREATDAGLPVVLSSQAPVGTLDPSLYESGRSALEAGAISCRDMTWEALLAKMMFLLARDCDLVAFQSKLLENYVGEISDESV